MPVKTCMLPGELCFVCHGGRGRGVEVGTKDEVRHPVALSSMLVPSHEAVLSHTMGRQHGKPDRDQTGMDVTAWETPHCGKAKPAGGLVAASDQGKVPPRQS